MFKDFINRLKVYFTRKILDILNLIGESYSKARSGEENMDNILYYWSLMPVILYFIILRFVNIRFITRTSDILIFMISILDLYFIAKTIKVHPEYDTKLMREIEKENYYSTLSDDELKNVKKEEKKDLKKKAFRKYFLLKSDEKTDLFKLVRIILMLTLLIVIKRLFF